MDHPRARCVCFTGHRVLASDQDFLRLRLELAIADLAEQGFGWFLSGMALGFDLLAAETVLRLSRRLEIGLVAVLPCPATGYTSAWPQEQRRRLVAVCEEAGELVLVSPGYHERCMQDRNQYLVDHSAYVLACLERDSGGTAQTVHFARQQGLQVRNLADSHLLR